MQAQFIIASIEAVYEVILNHEAELESLDRAIGDGDHYINISRGLTKLMDLRESLQDLSVDESLNKIAMTLLSTIGGASGPLFASFFMGMAQSFQQPSDMTAKLYANAFSAGVGKLAQRGKSSIGEKTMLDVLIPVADEFKLAANKDLTSKETASALIVTAEKGVLATKELLATKGRAAGLGERAIGHIDPGAKSCQLIIETICKLILR